MYILGMDLTKGFDTIDRHQLLIVIDSTLDKDTDKVQLIKALLSVTTPPTTPWYQMLLNIRK